MSEKKKEGRRVAAPGVCGVYVLDSTNLVMARVVSVGGEEGHEVLVLRLGDGEEVVARPGKGPGEFCPFELDIGSMDPAQRPGPLDPFPWLIGRSLHRRGWRRPRRETFEKEGARGCGAEWDQEAQGWVSRVGILAPPEGGVLGCFFGGWPEPLRALIGAELVERTCRLVGRGPRRISAVATAYVLLASRFDP